MSWDSLCTFILPAGIAYILLWFMLIRPLNIRYKKALASLLGKEIARSLYQQFHPQFSYDAKKYHPSDVIDEIVVKSALEMIATLRETENKKIF